ncbi:MAG TPA: hypothetical protein VMV49_01025, partial [Candidatus Deferrimicrobium sp.]|nr:hypothetical protein [Candidatus Deferrimicrobium sp.]
MNKLRENLTINQQNNRNQSSENSNSREDEETKVDLKTKIKRIFKKLELKPETPQNLLTAGLWQILGSLMAGLFTWLLIVIVSREDIGLGAGGVGIFNTAFAIFGIFSLLTVGIGKSTSQVVSENISDKKVAFQQARNGTFITIIVGIIIGAVMIIVSFFIAFPLSFQNTLSSILFIIGIAMFIAGIRDALASNLAAVGEYDDIAKAYSSFYLFQFISGILFIFLINKLNLPVTLIVCTYIFGIIAQSLILTRNFRHLWFNSQIFRFRQVDRRSLKILKHGFYFAITDIIPLALLGSISLIVLLAFTQNYAIVGAYSIILGYSFGALMVTGFAWPIITNVAEAFGKKDNEKIRYYLHLIIKIFFYVTFLTLTVTLSLSRGIIGVFHGQVYLSEITDVWIPFILVIIAF